MILMPNKGRVLINTGNKAQCIAHAIEVAIPRASQFNFIFILMELAKIVYLQYGCKIFYSIFIRNSQAKEKYIPFFSVNRWYQWQPVNL